MSRLLDETEGKEYFFMGNEAIARGALEAGVSVAAAYPGTPSSEIIENLSRVAGQRNLYVEWSANEKVALEVAAAASFAGLRSITAMKQNGVNVASDFLLHLAGSGIRGGMVVVSCDDPGALSSVNEGDARHFARLLEIPLLEPGDFQEAKDMTAWAFELAEELKTIVMLRSVTRLSHASGNIRLGRLRDLHRKAWFRNQGSILDPDDGPLVSTPVTCKHGRQQERMKRAGEIFEESPFNRYLGPARPELLIVTSSVCFLYCREALAIMGLEEQVGILKLATSWPLPNKLVLRHLALTDNVLIVEEVIPFLEENIKVLAAERAKEVGIKNFFGKREENLPTTGELNPDLVMAAIGQAMGREYPLSSPGYREKAQALSLRLAPVREQTFCAGCPHRASFWSIHKAIQLDGRQGFVCGDIGCYTMALLPCGFSTLKTLHSMGSGTGIASGFGQLSHFGLSQPVLAVCGDSTFFHAALPALINAVHHRANILIIILDNRGTAMTGFQSHPGLEQNAMNGPAKPVEIARICEAIGARVTEADPFDLGETGRALENAFDDEADGVRVLILRQMCALAPERRGKKRYEMSVNESFCLSEACGCNRLCTRILRCPGLMIDYSKGKAAIDEVVCAGCGICAGICPAGAIVRKEAAQA